MSTIQTEKPKVIVTVGESQSNCTFRFHEETHTIGNGLRHLLARDPNTEYVAYTIPHPSEPYLNFRLQCYEGSAQDHLLQGLSTFGDVADVILNEFERALADVQGGEVTQQKGQQKEQQKEQHKIIVKKESGDGKKSKKNKNTMTD
jgi:DNA-directed RNA polymerase subunit L